MLSRGFSLAVVATLIVTLWSGTARAELGDPTSDGVKGAVGLGLLGADLTLIIEGAIGVRNPWLLTLLPLAVAGGGAAGGWFAAGGNEPDGQGRSTVAVPLLVAGIALIIPAAILVAHGRSYRARRDRSEGFVDRTEEGEPMGTSLGDDEPLNGETRTEVVGPEEGEDGASEPEPEPEPEPVEDAPPPEEPESGALPTGGGLTVAQLGIDGEVPVGGVLRAAADEARRARRLHLTLAHF